MNLISIIVPIYGVEEFLDRCICSLVNQKSVNIEIILVDDGSQDNCPQMCDEWARKDNRIKVIHKENGGLSDARNEGLKFAQGDYIAFVDSDDWIDLNLYRTLLDAIKATASDIACCRYTKVIEKEDICNMNNQSEEYEIYSTTEALNELINDRKIQQVVWNKLYHRKVLYNIWFEKGKYHEDEFWSYQVIGNATKIVNVDYMGYFYRQRPNSIMGNNYSIKRLDAVEAKIQRQKYLEKNFPILELVGKRSVLYTCLYHGQLSIKYLDSNDKKEVMKTLKRIFQSIKIDRKERQQLELKDKCWLLFGGHCFELICRVRNLLKRGY